MTAAFEQPAAVCAATNCTRPADPVLCATDTRRLGDWLAQLGTEYERLSAAPSLQGREPGTGGGGGLASQQSPAYLDALVLRDPRTVMGTPTAQSRYQPRAPKQIGPWCVLCAHETCTEWRAGRQRSEDHQDDEHASRSDRLMSVIGVLEGWAAAVRDGRELARPDRVTVLSERKLLADHLSWILGQDWAGEFFDEIRALWGLLRYANGHHSGARRTVCRQTDCGGTVRWVEGAAVCGRCGHSVTGLDVLRKHAGEEAA